MAKRIRMLRNESPQHVQRIVGTQRRERLACVGVDHLPASGGLEAVDRPAAAHGNTDARRRGEAGMRRGLGRRQRETGQVERLHPRQSFLGGERWHSDVNEDRARDEPDDKDDRQRDTGPAVRVDERLAPVPYFLEVHSSGRESDESCRALDDHPVVNHLATRPTRSIGPNAPQSRLT
jgi:hypothetical protein